MKRKPQPKLSPIYKMLVQHKSSCTYFIFSGDRHCSCGRDEALKTVERVRGVLGEPLATELLGKPIG